jgi:hypothetical protein
MSPANIIEIESDPLLQANLQTEPNKRRRALNFVLSNSTWKRGDLSITFRQSFDLIAEDTTPGPTGGSGGGGNPPDCPNWWAFLDTYRTLCLAPDSKIREIFEELRSGRYAELIE